MQPARYVTERNHIRRRPRIESKPVNFSFVIIQYLYWFLFVPQTKRRKLCSIICKKNSECFYHRHANNGLHKMQPIAFVLCALHRCLQLSAHMCEKSDWIRTATTDIIHPRHSRVQLCAVQCTTFLFHAHETCTLAEQLAASQFQMRGKQKWTKNRCFFFVWLRFCFCFVHLFTGFDQHHIKSYIHEWIPTFISIYAVHFHLRCVDAVRKIFVCCVVS